MPQERIIYGNKEPKIPCYKEKKKDRRIKKTKQWHSLFLKNYGSWSFFIKCMKEAKIPKKGIPVERLDMIKQIKSEIDPKLDETLFRMNISRNDHQDLRYALCVDKIKLGSHYDTARTRFVGGEYLDETVDFKKFRAMAEDGVRDFTSNKDGTVFISVTNKLNWIFYLCTV